MALTEEQITAKNFQKFYNLILPYLNSAPGCTPIGTIIAVMGNSAPAYYLKCDGTIYNIVDYPDLANYFEVQFDGEINKFGGDGTTTFAVPDLRGEFLRGTGTNSHINTATNLNEGSGGAVGEHQQSTSFPASQWGNKRSYVGGSSNVGFGAVDTEITATGYTYNQAGGQPTTGSYRKIITARPTNTSVLYCIAYKNIYAESSGGGGGTTYTAGDGIDITNDIISVDEMSSGDMSEIISPLPSTMSRRMKYSTEEQIVGQWVDGKPLYQITFLLDGTYTGAMDNIFDIGSNKVVHHFFGVGLEGDSYVTIPMVNVQYSTSNFGIWIGTNGKACLRGGTKSWSHFEITVQYTKTTD